ncbi:hypothetical protein MASR1M8_11830 [Thermomonas brevis]
MHAHTHPRTHPMARRHPRFPFHWLALAALLLAAWWFLRAPEPAPALPAPAATAPASGDRAPVPLGLPPAPTVVGDPPAALPGFLPPEAHRTIALIQRGGPYPYRQDDGIFGNREGHLPKKPRGWYREYTVDTPGLRHRGARRIVTGGDPPREWYYTDDHYDSFRRFDVPGTTQ